MSNGITRKIRRELYSASRYLSSKTERDLGLPLLLSVYLQDPAVAESQPHFGLDEKFEVRWEPNLDDGPTSSRLRL